MTYRHALVWLRRDLRLHDHSALAKACANAESVAVCYIAGPSMPGAPDPLSRRWNFLLGCLQEVSESLATRGSALIFRCGEPLRELEAICRELDVDAVYVSEDYDPSNKAGDEKIKEALFARGVRFHECKDQVIFGSRELLNSSGEPFRVFTPYKRAWLRRLAAEEGEPARARRPRLERLIPARRLRGLTAPSEELPAPPDFDASDLFSAPGSRAGRRAMARFKGKLPAYHRIRDFPARGGTSRLSPHLRFGTLSVRETVRLAARHPSQGADAWLSELIWRDFFQMILDQFPHVVNGSFRREYDSIRWPGPREHFKAWCNGETGYPLVDAAMRHLNRTGWMHNRLRMVTASFLVKDLLIDWREGERYFATQLIDHDTAANNGGWQWSASTGCDAQPYFRIFNPVSQSRRFDPAGEFIRGEFPERESLPDSLIHEPIDPIVSHEAQRARALALFVNAKPGRRR